MQLRNTTTIPNDLVREVINFVRPSGIRNFDVEIRNSFGANWGGRAYVGGSSYHRNNNKFVVVRVADGEPGPIVPSIGRKIGKSYSSHDQKVWREWRPTYPMFYTPYQYGQLKGKKYWIKDRIELLVIGLAHELRHIWQGKTKNKRGYAFGSKGRYSEIDTDSYAIHMLRAWRKRA